MISKIKIFSPKIFPLSAYIVGKFLSSGEPVLAAGSLSVKGDFTILPGLKNEIETFSARKGTDNMVQ